MKKVLNFLLIFNFLLFCFFLLPKTIKAAKNTKTTQVDIFQITTDGSQQKDPFIFKDLIVYDSLSDIWGYNLETKENFPIIQKEGS